MTENKERLSTIQFYGATVLIGLLVGGFNFFFNGNSLLSSSISLAYTLLIASLIMGTGWLVFRLSIEVKPFVLFTSHLMAGVMAHLIVILSAVLITGHQFPFVSRKLVLAMAVGIVLGQLNLRMGRPKPQNKKNEGGERDYLTVRLRNSIRLIGFEEIHYLEARDKYVNVHLDQDEHLSSRTLSELMATLPANFLQIHRSYIINRNFVKEIIKQPRGIYAFVMTNGTTLKSGHTYKDKLRSLFE